MQMQEQKPKKRISFMFTFIMCIIVGVAEFFILNGGYLGYKIVKVNNHSSKTEKTTDSKTNKDETKDDHITEEELINSIEANTLNKYAYIDLDGDDYDEMLTYVMVDESNFDLTLYKGDEDGLVRQSKLLEKADMNLNIIIKEYDKDYMVLVYAYEGVEKITRVYYEDGKFKRKIVANHTVDDYDYLSMNDSIEWIVK